MREGPLSAGAGFAKAIELSAHGSPGHTIPPAVACCGFGQGWEQIKHEYNTREGRSFRLQRRNRMDAKEGGGSMRGPYGIVGLVVTIIIVVVVLRLLGVL